jgi:tight adherence protein B
MTSESVPLLLLVGAALSLFGLAVSGMMVSRAQQREARRRERFDSVMGRHQRGTEAELVTFLQPVNRGPRSFMATIAWIFGFQLDKTALYPTKWWMVVIVTLFIALGVRWVSTELLGDIAIVTLPIAWIFFSRRYFNWFESRRRNLLLGQFPDALSMIVRSIRVGIPVMEAIRIVARETPQPSADEFTYLLDQVAIGSSLEDAVADLARRSGLAEYRFFATTLALQNSTGGTLSDTLDGLADVIRKRAALKSRAKALTSEARASAMILTALPFGTGGLMYVVNPPYMMLLFQHPTGKTLLISAIVSLSLGVLTIRTIIQKSLPS